MNLNVDDRLVAVAKIVERDGEDADDDNSTTSEALVETDAPDEGMTEESSEPRDSEDEGED